VFASIVSVWGTDNAVAQEFHKYTPGGEARLQRLMSLVKAAYEKRERIEAKRK